MFGAAGGINVLYLGGDSIGSTSAHRANAIRRLGYTVLVLNPWCLIPRFNKILAWFHYRTAYRMLQRCLRLAFQHTLAESGFKPSIIWVNSGELLGLSILKWLQSQYNCPLVLYCNDDPTGPRDWNRFASLRRVMPLYDLCICPRQVNEIEWLALGASKVLRVWMSYDEVYHGMARTLDFPAPEVGFIGTNIPADDRDEFLFHLLKSGIPLSLFGANWHRSKHWGQLRPYWHGSSLENNAYADQLSNVAMCLGLLSHQNRDLHTQRTLEVPAAGGVLLAERSSEHQLLFEESVEALYWETVTDCSQLAQHMLGCFLELSAIRKAGHQRLVEIGVGNEDVVSHALAALA